MKKRISIYHYSYLPLSETFIYRQLQGLSQYFDLNLLTGSMQNSGEFPGLDPIMLQHQSFLGRRLGLHDRFIRRQLQGSRLFHVNFGHIALDMQRYAQKAGIPMTAYFLGVDASALLRNPEYRKKLKSAVFEAVFVNSEDMKRRLAPYLPPAMQLHVAYCGIPLERFQFRQRHAVPEGALFLQVSRLDKKKGVGVTLQAFSRYVNESDPKARLIIAGDGPLKTALKELSLSLGLKEKVRFIGPIGYHKYFELLQAADVFMHPSVTADDGDMEGLPTAICEAMACGLPVLSTRHSGIPELIDDGENGFLAEEGDVDGLYRKMTLLGAADIGEISRKARIKIENKFDHNKTITILSEYMNRIVTGGVREL